MLAWNAIWVKPRPSLDIRVIYAILKSALDRGYSGRASGQAAGLVTNEHKR